MIEHFPNYSKIPYEYLVIVGNLLCSKIKQN